MAESLSFFPSAKVFRQTQESRNRAIVNQPKEIKPPNQEHLHRHWQQLDAAHESPAFLGSLFEPNDAFKNIESLTTFLQSAASELIPIGEYDRRHIVTILFPYSIGKTAITELSNNDDVQIATRDKGAQAKLKLTL